MGRTGPGEQKKWLWGTPGTAACRGAFLFCDQKKDREKSRWGLTGNGILP